MTEKTRKRLTALGIGLFLAGMAALTVFVGRPLVRYARDPEQFRQWIGEYGMWGRAMFAGVVFLQTVVAFIPGEPFEIVAGYAFGAFWGTALCLIGELAGSVTVFWFVRRYGTRVVEVFFPREKIESLKFLQNEKKLETFTFFVFLVPGTPKDLLCYFVGLTHMRLPVWLLISSVGRFPSVITSTLGGNALGLGRHSFAIAVFAATLVVSALGLMSYNRWTSMRAKHFENEKRRQARAEKKRVRAQKKRRNLRREKKKRLFPARVQGKNRANSASR